MKVKASVVGNTLVSVASVSTTMAVTQDLIIQVVVLLASVLLPPLIERFLPKKTLRKQLEKQRELAVKNGDKKLVEYLDMVIAGLGD